jgi:cytochrome c oxidase assembly protein subunit 15
MNSSSTYSSVRIWLLVGICMVFIQVIVGGITRLTESGLSITKWEVVSGTIPPVSDSDWLNEFELYKQTPQYKEINEGMTLDDFKFIYFWEYIHRFWARLMGFVFLFPFLFFYFKKMLQGQLLRDLALVIFLAGLAATFGWIMVASGLVDRPWVNAYKLSLHLLIAISVFLSLLWAYLRYISFQLLVEQDTGSRILRLFFFFCIVFFCQLLLGGILSGMRAAVAFPTWPTMYGQYIPSVLLDSTQWTMDHVLWYDQNAFMPALIHFLHRNTAYLLFGVGAFISYKMYSAGTLLRNKGMKIAAFTFLGILLLQVLLGILTVVQSIGEIPVLWGVLHQAGALILASCIAVIIFGLSSTNTIK